MTARDPPRVLVAAIGNPDRGDDGIGPAVARQLRGRVPDGVRVIERRGDILALVDEWQGFALVFIVDAASPSGQPGRIHRLDLSSRPLPDGFARSSTHAFGVGEAVELARRLERLPPRIVAYLVEGGRFGLGEPLSPAVAAVVDTVGERICAELARQRRGFGKKDHPRMHETALVRDIVHRIEDLARPTGARVVRARIWLGALSHLSTEHFREHFAIESRETSAAGAQLDIDVSDDAGDPDARHIRLVSVDLDDEDAR
jgi:hydrogenase maturation protease